MSSFYVGYLPKAPADLARFMRRIVAGLLAIIAIVGVLLVIAQQRFSPSAFEWQQVRSFEGVIQQWPYPTLLVRRPGVTELGEQFSRYLLVGVGKHGASPEVAGYDGQSANLEGKLIYRDGQTLIEVMPSTISALPAAGAVTGSARDLGQVTLRGEIVDTKCYVGVMNPGRGKVHRDCAVRCISGGIPPALLATDRDGQSHLYLLTTSNGDAVDPRGILSKVGQPVRVGGRLFAQGDTLSVRIASIEND